jgi:excinuclease ABC subunit C
MGTNAVGAMIVAGEEGFSKKHYRTYNIRSTDITPGDDFGMMREVLTRRFSRLASESPVEPRTSRPACPTGPMSSSSTAAPASSTPCAR